jgi:hypothetical protein
MPDKTQKRGFSILVRSHAKKNSGIFKMLQKVCVTKYVMFYGITQYKDILCVE